MTFVKSSSLPSAALAADAALSAYLRSLADQRAAALGEEPSNELARRHPGAALAPRPVLVRRRGGGASALS